MKTILPLATKQTVAALDAQAFGTAMPAALFSNQNHKNRPNQFLS